jgi:hypothetical protein
MLHCKLSLSYFEIHLSKFESYICFQGLSTSNMEIVAWKYSGFIKIILEIHVFLSKNYVFPTLEKYRQVPDYKAAVPDSNPMKASIPVGSIR